MNAVSNPTDLCAICRGAHKKKPSKELPYPSLPAFIRRFLARGAVITLKPCNHRFHLQCISRWMNKSSQCPLDRRYITGSTPPLLRPVEVDLHQELDKAIENNQIEKVKDILLSSLTPKRQSRVIEVFPLSVAIEDCRWEIAGLLHKAGWHTHKFNALGWMYYNGLGVEQDYTKALDYYAFEAEHGSRLATRILGSMYEKALGVEQNYTKAFLLYQEAASREDPKAQNRLGCLYLKGLGVEKNYDMALFWYRKADKLKNGEARNNLGLMYRDGLGVEQDYTKAASWFHTSALWNNNAAAQKNLGYMCQHGLGVEQNYTRALYYYRKAADQGNLTALETMRLLQLEVASLESN